MDAHRRSAVPQFLAGSRVEGIQDRSAPAPGTHGGARRGEHDAVDHNRRSRPRHVARAPGRLERNGAAPSPVRRNARTAPPVTRAVGLSELRGAGQRTRRRCGNPAGARVFPRGDRPGREATGLRELRRLDQRRLDQRRLVIRAAERGGVEHVEAAVSVRRGDQRATALREHDRRRGERRRGGEPVLRGQRARIERDDRVREGRVIGGGAGRHVEVPSAPKAGPSAPAMRAPLASQLVTVLALSARLIA